MTTSLFIFISMLGLIILACLWSYATLHRKNILIRKGTHGPMYDFSFHTGITKCSITCAFDKECWYEDDERDINKLYGFSYGQHHDNSVRFGWRPDKNNEGLIEVFAYIYQNGNRRHEILEWVPVEKFYTYQAEWFKEYIIFRIIRPDKTDALKTIMVPRPKVMWGYRLFFYFGGDKLAPKDMKLKIKNVK